MRNVLYSYPALKAQHDALHNPSLAVATVKIEQRGKASARVTENIALREMAPQDQREYDAVTQAIESTRRLKTGDERLTIIDMVFFRRTHTLYGAGRTIGYSYGQVKNFQSEFIVAVARNIGLLPKD